MKQITKTFFIGFLTCLMIASSALTVFALPIGNPPGGSSSGAISGIPLPTTVNSTNNPYDNGNTGIDPGLNQTHDQIKGPSKENDIQKLILGWIRWALGFVMLIAIVSIMVGGAMYLTSFGNDTKTQKARKLMIASMIGLVIIMFSYIIVQFVFNLAK